LPPGAECGRSVSRRQTQRLANDVGAAELFLGQSAIGFEHQRNGLREVSAGFVEGRAVRVSTWELFDEAAVALGNPSKDGGELELHGLNLSWGQVAV
jgi:hypothetical protein